MRFSISLRPWNKTLLLSLCLLVSLSSYSQAQTPVNSCGTVSGNVILTADLSSTNTSCLTAGSDNTTIDGNGHTITVTGTGEIFAVYVPFKAHVTIKNLHSNRAVRYYGDAAQYGLVENCDIGGLENYYGDFITIRNNKLKGMLLWAFAATITGNEIVGGGQHPIDISNKGTGYTNCPSRGLNPSDPTYNHIFENNIVINNNPDPGGGSTGLYLRCSSNNLIRNNVFVGTLDASALFMRDSANDNILEYNTIWADAAPRAAMFWGDGAAPGTGPTEPKNNTFRYNLFRGNTSRGFEARVSDGNNLFAYNLFLSNNAQGDRLVIDSGFTDTYDHNTFYNYSSAGSSIRFVAPPDGFINLTHNIIDYGGTNSPFEWSNPWGSTRDATPAEVTADSNTYFNRTGTVSFGIYGNSLSAWQTNTGDDTHSRIMDPLFTNPSALDFRIGQPAAEGALLSSNPGCTENWTCTNWSNTCAMGVQVRSCMDSGNCRTWNSKPATTRACSGGDTTPPSLAIISPSNGATVASPLTISGTASDNTGLARVEVQVDGGSAQNASGTNAWSLTLGTLTNGSHTLLARAVDTSNNTATQTISVTVNNPVDVSSPTISILVPSGGATITSALTVSGTAADNVGVTLVETSLDGGAFGSATGTTNWTKSLGTLSNGSHSVSARAKDAAGNTSPLASVNFTVNIASSSCGSLPLDFFGTSVGTEKCIQLNSNLTSATEVTLTMTANDIDAAEETKMYVNGNLLGLPSNIYGDGATLTGSVSVPLNNLVSGNNEIKFRFDSNLNGTTGGFRIDAVRIDITTGSAGGDTTPPTLDITSPSSGATVSGNITVSGTASDNVGVTQAQVQVDAGTAQTASGTSTWNLQLDTRNLTNGPHMLTATARDAAGNNSSVSITVTVNNTMDTSPVISILSPLDGSKVKSPVSVNITGSDNMAVS
ncbi:MAG: right-handed parallel beta-helix repeat-containing protein, partial [Elusimicrobia bacterium]|nr:right-handed parallel beta-helix repeat-containing protein [Elusimicrobiota bacterium]